MTDKTDMSAAQKLDKKTTIKPSRWSDVNAVRGEVIGLVAANEFNKAIHVLKQFSEKDFVYPNFKLKVERYLSHAIDLILAIEANRKFSDLSSLTRSKQQELKEKFNKHSEELKIMLEKVELAYNDLRIKDSRSTQYVVQSVWLSILIVSISALILDMLSGLSRTVLIVLESGVDQVTDVLSKYL
ncbi:MAG: hypothetical protein H7235_12270 [Bdellovibrionaceae bacterium]|nr:hypothetical protein [Pseudobdellovibrionaceae bacterium]